MYVYSKRLSWDFSPNAITQKLERQRARGLELLDLTISNPTTSLGRLYPHEQIRRISSEMNDFSYEPNPAGYPPAVGAVRDYYRERGIAAPEDRLLLTTSTSEAYSFLFKLLCDPGDEVLVPLPSYPLFEYLARLENVTTVPYRLAYDGSWFFDFDHLELQISPRTRAVVIVNPNNPTGSFLKAREWEQLATIAAARSLPLISDEVFMDYSLVEASTRLQTLIGHDEVLSFSLNGLSKSAGMPQLKLGWMVVNGPAPERSSSLQKLELIADTFLSVGTPVQHALPHLLRLGESVQNDLRQRIAANLQTAKEQLEGTAVHPLHVEGGWSVILQMPATASEEAWIERLLDRGVIVQPGYFFDMESEPHIVVSLITDENVFRRGIEVIRNFSEATQY